MKKNADHLYRRQPRVAPHSMRVDREAPSVRDDPVPDYFTLFLLQELLSTIGWRHKH